MIVCAYNSRRKIAATLETLEAQECDDPFEIIVVDSGSDGCCEYVQAAFPDVRLVRSERRLYPGPARNAGIAVAHGEYIAFVPDDGIVSRDWLQRRLAKHRLGFPLVGGAISNGTPRSLVGTANYYLEYSALIPNEAILEEQAIPCLSFDRRVFDRNGLYPEDTTTGEDTLFNLRCLRAGERVAFAADVRLAHMNLTSLRKSLEHHVDHGRGLVQCVFRHGLESSVGDADQMTAAAAIRMFALYPMWGLIAKFRRLWVHDREALVRFLPLSPMVLAGLAATGAGAFAEWRELRRRSRQELTNTGRPSGLSL